MPELTRQALVNAVNRTLSSSKAMPVKFTLSGRIGRHRFVLGSVEQSADEIVLVGAPDSSEHFGNGGWTKVEDIGRLTIMPTHIISRNGSRIDVYVPEDAGDTPELVHLTIFA